MFDEENFDEHESNHSIVLSTSELKVLDEIALNGAQKMHEYFSSEQRKSVRTLMSKIEYAIYVNSNFYKQKTNIFSFDQWKTQLMDLA